MSDEYISLETFAEQTGVKLATIKRKHGKNPIPGIEKDEETKVYRVQKGTRYPYDLRHLGKKKPLTSFEILENILKAINQRRYIDAAILNISDDLFQSMISELLERNLIRENDSSNPFGANRYDITFDGGTELADSKKAILEYIAKAIGTGLGVGFNAILQGA